MLHEYYLNHISKKRKHTKSVGITHRKTHVLYILLNDKMNSYNEKINTIIITYIRS